MIFKHAAGCPLIEIVVHTQVAQLQLCCAIGDAQLGAKATRKSRFRQTAKAATR